jgi:hypothetical protein
MWMWFAIAYLACFAVLLELFDRAANEPSLKNAEPVKWQPHQERDPANG